MILLVSLHNFSFSSSNMSVNISNNTILTNDKTKINRKLELFPGIKACIGNMEYDDLLNGRVIVIREEEKNDIDIVKELLRFLFDIQLFSNAVWVDNDSCIDTETGFAFNNIDGTICSNMIKNGFTNSEGGKHDIVLSFSDTNRIITEIYNRFISMFELQIGKNIALEKDLKDRQELYIILRKPDQ